MTPEQGDIILIPTPFTDLFLSEATTGHRGFEQCLQSRYRRHRCCSNDFKSQNSGLFFHNHHSRP